MTPATTINRSSRGGCGSQSRSYISSQLNFPFLSFKSFPPGPRGGWGGGGGWEWGGGGMGVGGGWGWDGRVKCGVHTQV
jgi:hypothetical protein